MHDVYTTHRGSAVDNVRVFEEHLLSSGKMYDSADQSQKSFVYPPPAASGPAPGQGAVVGGGVGQGLNQGRGRGRVGKRGSPTSKIAQPFNPSSSLSVPSGITSIQGLNLNQRARLSIPDSTSYPATALVSPVHKPGGVGASNTGETPAAAVSLAGISRSSSTGDSQSPLLSSVTSKAAVLSVPTLSLSSTSTPTPTAVLPSTSALSGSLPFPLGHPQESLDTLGVSLDQQDDVIASASGQGHGSEGYHGYDEYGGHVEEEDEEEEVAERGSIAMSNKPFRVGLSS